MTAPSPSFLVPIPVHGLFDLSLDRHEHAVGDGWGAEVDELIVSPLPFAHELAVAANDLDRPIGLGGDVAIPHDDFDLVVLLRHSPSVTGHRSPAGPSGRMKYRNKSGSKRQRGLAASANPDTAR